MGRTVFEISMNKVKWVICLLLDGIYMVVPGQFIIYSDAQVLCILCGGNNSPWIEPQMILSNLEILARSRSRFYSFKFVKICFNTNNTYQCQWEKLKMSWSHQTQRTEDLCWLLTVDKYLDVLQYLFYMYLIILQFSILLLPLSFWDTQKIFF